MRVKQYGRLSLATAELLSTYVKRYRVQVVVDVSVVTYQSALVRNHTITLQQPDPSRLAVMWLLRATVEPDPRHLADRPIPSSVFQQRINFSQMSSSVNTFVRYT